MGDNKVTIPQILDPVVSSSKSAESAESAESVESLPEWYDKVTKRHNLGNSGNYYDIMKNSIVTDFGGRRRSSTKKRGSRRKPRSTKKRATRRYRRRT